MSVRWGPKWVYRSAVMYGAYYHHHQTDWETERVSLMTLTTFLNYDKAFDEGPRNEDL
jgi:hypothetical protein